MNTFLQNQKSGGYRKEIRFLILFILLFFSLQGLHYIARPYITPFVVYTLTTGGSSKLINMITPEENTRPKKNF